jgi:ActR/RegA family two-component response regulator
MSDLETQRKIALGQVNRQRVDAPETTTSLWQCLVVSSSENHRTFLSQSANSGGWDTVICSDEKNALNVFRKIRFKLAIVDLYQVFGNELVRLQGFCETIATQSDLLLTVCGNESDPQEELWARQLGVWLYLPGVSLDHEEEFTAICEQAQLVAGFSNEGF